MSLDPLSSGDMIADRRADYARMLCDGGDPAAAADLMTQALERAPDWPAGWFHLAGYEEKSGRTLAAGDALRKVLALSPSDVFGAGLRLAVLTGAAMPNLPPSLYVERLFDDYAGRFDEALTGRLNYCVPQKLCALMLAQVGQTHRFSHVADLGCGTGLFGACIRDHADVLEGFDLSVNMLARAREKQLYDHLAQADLSLPPENCGVFASGAETGRATLVSAADVLIYLGDLTSVFVIAARLIAPGGLFAFSVEDAGGEEPYVLRPSLRTAHSQRYVERMCAAYGFNIIGVEKTVLRQDGGHGVDGILFVAAGLQGPAF